MSITVILLEDMTFERLAGLYGQLFANNGAKCKKYLVVHPSKFKIKYFVGS